MEKRLKNLEVEVAYLRKEILRLIELIANSDMDNHIYYTNVFYSKDYLDSFNEGYE